MKTTELRRVKKYAEFVQRAVDDMNDAEFWQMAYQSLEKAAQLVVKTASDGDPAKFGDAMDGLLMQMSSIKALAQLRAQERA